MRNMKKTLCVVLATVMTILCWSTVAMGAEANFSDVPGDAIYTTAVKTLNLMGVINGYPDGTFGPSQNVTRAEFTAMLMRTLNLGTVGSNSASGLPFSDIADNNTDINWAIPNINTAYGMGIINGYEDGTFRPSDNVAYEEAVKMVVCALGYGVGVDVSLLPWYSGYLTLANQLGITKTASKINVPETPASRACIAQLLYDSLEVDLVENNEKTDKNILNNYLGYQKCTGIIYSNDITSLSSPDVNLRDNEIQIYAQEGNSSNYELHTYTTDDKSLRDYIGYEVEFYYTSDGSDDRNLMLYVVNESDSVTVNAAHIEVSDSNETEVAYYENRDDSKVKNLRLENDNIVIYNGKLYGDDTESSMFETSMLPDVGQVTFLDSDKNGKYDIVKIEAYEIFYVSNKANATHEVIDHMLYHEGSKSVKLDVDKDSNLYIVDEDGDEVSFSSIATGNIVCIAKSNSGTPTTRAIVLNNKVTGTVSASRGNKITISGKDYYYSPVAPWLNGMPVDEPRTQDEGTFYLDMNGDIVAYSTESVSNNVKYGFIMGYTVSEDFDSEILIRIMDSNGKIEDYGIYRNTSVNNKNLSNGDDVIQKLKETATNPGDTEQFSIQQLVKFTTRSSSGNAVLADIYTAEGESKGGKVESNKLMMLDTISADDSAEYSSSTRTLAVGTVRVTVSNSIIFSIPKDRRSFDEYKISSVSSSFKNGVSNYSIEAFDVSTANNAKVIVSYGADNSQAVSTESPLYIVDEMSEVRDSDGTMLPMVTGYKVSMDTSFTDCEDMLSADSDNGAFSLDTGDIFRAGTDSKGYSLYEEDNLIYSVGGNNKFGIYRDKQEANVDIMEAEFAVILGSVVARDDSAIVVVPQELSMGDEYGTDPDDENDQEYIFPVSSFNKATALIYDESGSRLSLVEESSCEDALALLNSSIEDSEPGKVLIYLSEGKIKLLCILPQ